MDAQEAHFVTLWCAAVSKFEKGLSRALGPALTPAQYRVLASLESALASCGPKEHLAWATSMRPDEVQSALEDLAATSLVSLQPTSAGAVPSERAQAAGGKQPSPCARLTLAGRTVLHEANVAVTDWGSRCTAALSSDEMRFLASALKQALTVPGSFYARHLSSGAAALSLAQQTTSLHAIHQAMVHVVRKNIDLSLTDFRFLLELYPKKQRTAKRLRAREIVGYLRVGRSYVTTASLRLEQKGLIERIPDEQDARGILFSLTSQGTEAVRITGDDIFVLLTSLFGNLIEDRRFLLLMKHWLQAEDEALATKRP